MKRQVTADRRESHIIHITRAALYQLSYHSIHLPVPFLEQLGGKIDPGSVRQHQSKAFIIGEMHSTHCVPPQQLTLSPLFY